jgi:hypothetical protein
MHPLVLLASSPRRLGVLWLGFNIVSACVHLLVVLAVAFIAWGLIKRGARAVNRRL